MNSLPVRFFHACLSGLFGGLLLALLFFHIQGRFLHREEIPQQITDITPSPLPTPSPAPVASDPPANPDDLDGDGIPNAWETQFHHDPQSPADAGADFDNDGLTALQEYQLYQQSAGATSNPLGHWRVEEKQIPEYLADASLYPVDINKHGDVLVQLSATIDGVWRDIAFLIDSENVWTEISSWDEYDPGYLYAFDLNDNGEVVGERWSSDWSALEPFIWDPHEGYRLFTFNGEIGHPYKMNNHGDWIGYLEDSSTGSWNMAYVVDGFNRHAPDDWWSSVWYTDLNDYGEAMGTFYDSLTSHYHTFLSYGGWLFNTGLLGSPPFFDESTNSYMWSSAMNAYGEFTGGAYSLQNNQWDYTGYHFDGEFHEIKFSGRELDYLSPESINSANTITGYAWDNLDSHSGGFIYRDGIGLFLDELLPEIGSNYTSRINEKGQFIARNQYGNQLFLVSPDQDQDGDGMSDDWEDFYGLDKNLASDAYADADGDGTNNLGEFMLRSDPENPPVEGSNGHTIDLRPGIDTDGDGIPNIWEWQNGLAYDDPSDASLDYDRDGYSNLQEFRLNTDPRGAPSYRMRVIGPFPGARSAGLSSAVLGDGQFSGNTATHLGTNIKETAYFNAEPVTTAYGGYRPSAWSVLRGDDSGSFSFASSHGTAHSYPVVHSPSGASLCEIYSNPRQFVFWSSPTAQPVTLSGAANQNDIANLSYVRISPSGGYVTGNRQTASSSGYQPVVWKMPTSPTSTFKPIHLIPPAGVTLTSWGNYFINDHGYVVANGYVSGQNRPILWKVSADGTTATASILPPLPGSNWASGNGISNQDPPLICGTSSVSSQNRAVVWTAAGAITNLGTLPGGNSSSASLISRGGSIAGISNVLEDNTLKQQLFLATYVAATSSWKLQAQGEPAANPPRLNSVNDFGEILGYYYVNTPPYITNHTLWRHGRAYPIESCFGGALLDNVTQLSPHGTLLATVNRDGTTLTVLLTPDRDTDGDGLPDAYENQHGFNAFVKNNPATDSDSDGLSDLEEFRNNTDPRNPDTDGDGMKDDFEVSWGLLPLDPTDAPLDPDNDRVTNLRESQIGTPPTGIYKVQTRFTDTAWIHPYVKAVADDGQIVHTGQWTNIGDTDENGNSWTESIQEYEALPPADAGPSATSVALPAQGYIQSYDSSGNSVSYTEEFTAHRPDGETGQINGEVFRHGYDYMQNTYYQTMYLIPDASNHLDEGEWILWANIDVNLHNPDLCGGTAPLDEYNTVNPWPEAVSLSGKRRLHRTSSYECLVLNERGEFVEKLADHSTWQFINDVGIAARLDSVLTTPPDGGTDYYAPVMVLSTGETIQIPHQPGTQDYYSLQGLSNDGMALLSQSVRNEQLASYNRYLLFDIATGTLRSVRQPGLGYESVTTLSTSNSRLLGNGPKPFQITPDGTCIRLDALRIKNTPSATPVPFGNLYPGTLTPNHIASNGRITLTTSDNSNQQVILQITPHNDADNDGMPDDWETSYDLTDPDGDADSDGYTNLEEFTTGTDVSNQDGDGDGIPDGIDSQPLTNSQQFPDADGDGIPDADDAEPSNPRGPTPSVASENASGNPVSNLTKDETVKFVITVSNPAGPAPSAADLAFFINGKEEPADILDITPAPPSGGVQSPTRRFLLAWTAKTTADYPKTFIQNLTLRFRDAQQATSWFKLARIDVAEWEGMVAWIQAGIPGPISSQWVARLRSHSSGISQEASDLGTENRGKTVWYRGPRTVPIYDYHGVPHNFSFTIADGMRYPLVMLSGGNNAPFVIHAIMDISNPASYPHANTWIHNRYGKSVTVKYDATQFTISDGTTVHSPMAELTDPNQDRIVVQMETLVDGVMKTIFSSKWSRYSAWGVRRIASLTLLPPQEGRFLYHSPETTLTISANIKPHAAGTLAYPGLPLTSEFRPPDYWQAYQSGMLPFSQDTWHKVVLKAGPDAEAVSNGIGLWLRKGQAGDVAPQPGFVLKVQDAAGAIQDLTVPGDGKITLAVGTPNHQQLLSPAGLTVFMSRSATVTDTHDLSLQLLKKRDWYPQESVRIASMDIIPLAFELPGASYADGTNPNAPAVDTSVLPVSNSAPVIKLGPVSATINSSAGTIAVHIDGLEVRDAMTDNYPEGEGGEVESVSMWLLSDDGETLLSSSDLTRESDGGAMRWRQHPKCFNAGAINVTIPLKAGTQVIEFRTSENLIGNIGTAQALVTAWQQGEPPQLVSGQTALLRLGLPEDINSDTVDPITLFDLRLGTSATLLETSADSREFLGQINGVPVAVMLPDGQIGTSQLQTLEVGIVLGDPDDQPRGAVVTVAETTATSNLYQATITWAMEVEGDITWQVRAMHGDSSPAGSYSPIAFRMPVMGDPAEWRMLIGPHEIAFESGIDGKMHLKGGSEGFITITHETRPSGNLEYMARGINASGEAFEHSYGTQIPAVPITLRFPVVTGVNLIDIGTVPVTAPMLNNITGELGTALRARQGQPNQANLWHLNNVAWIEPHSNNNGPGMPSLRARLAAPTGQSGDHMEVRWRLEVSYNRPFNGSRPGATWRMDPPRLNMDYVIVPGDRNAMDSTPELQGWTPPEWLPRPGKTANAAGTQEAWSGWMPIDQEWDISTDPAWIREIGWGFFGGEAVLRYQTRTNGGAASQTQRFEFRIGGKNPNDTDCQTYIEGNDVDTADFEHWYAYGIAKHETYGYNVRTRVPRSGQVAINPGNVFGNPNDSTLGLYYNHFWEGTPGGYRGAGVVLHNDDQTGDRRSLNALGRAVPGSDGIPDGTGGFGLFQLTYEQGENQFYMPRGWIWNWQHNVNFGIEKCRTKRVQSVTSVPDVPERNYVRHAVPRVRNPDNVGTRTDNTDGDPMNSAATDGVISGADANNHTAPNGFPIFTNENPDYRRAVFSNRAGYLILNTIRRFNGGNYCDFVSEGGNDGFWRFKRWRGNGETSNGRQVDQYERKSYVDTVFREIDPNDIPHSYSKLRSS